MKTRLLLSLLGLSLGGGILIISLFSATQVSSNGKGAATESKLYFSQQILPDHSFYKVLMAMDRIQLETATPQEQIFIRLEYANRRLDYAKALLEKDNEPLAMSTLLKSQQYLNQAVLAALKSDQSQSLAERMTKTLDYHTAQLRMLSPQLTDESRAVVDRLIEEHLALRANLTSLLAKN